MTSPVIRPSGGQLNQQIANTVVQARKGLLGRGPTDALTAGERRLADGGERDAVLGMRQRYQQVLRAELVGAIEALTAGKVEARMSGNHIDPDLAFELFVLDRAVPGEPVDPA